MTDFEWDRFSNEILTPRFPLGMTIIEGKGQWKGRNGSIEHERSQMVTLFHPASENDRRAIVEIVTEYKRRFAQEAVFHERVESCVTFD